MYEPLRVPAVKVLVACEFSGVVRDAFRERGHDAVSCDIIPAAGNHRRGDVRSVLREGWDLVVAHPPCTYLCHAGVHWLRRRKDRAGKVVQAALFFKACLEAEAPRVAVENPVMHGWALALVGRDYDQIVHPWQFGDPEPKPTCLWLRGLPPLRPTVVVEPKRRGNPVDPRHRELGRGRMRSITYPGLARAMAEQWGDL